MACYLADMIRPQLKLIILISVFLQFGNSQPLKFEHFSGDQGLSQSSVMSVLQDSKGFLWIGTWDGLNRYDGYTFRHFHYDPYDSTSIPNNSIIKIVEDVHGDIWLATAGAGLALYERKKDSFRKNFIDDRNGANTRIPFVQQVYTKDARTIVATYDGDLYIIDAVTKRVRHVLMDTVISRRYSREESAGAFRFVVKKRLVSLMPDGRLLVQDLFRDRLTALNQSISIRILEHSDGTLYFASGTRGVWTFDWEQYELVPMYVHSDDPSSISDDAVNMIFRDSRGELWIATDNGLNISQRNSAGVITGFKRYATDASDPASISHSRVYCVTEDRSGVMWIGTQNGLNKLIPGRKKFTSLPKDGSFRRMISGMFPASLFEENDTTVWIGTTGPLIRYNPRTDQWRRIKIFFEGVSVEQIYNIFKDHRGKMWMTTSAGVGRFDPRTFRFTPFMSPSTEEWKRTYTRGYALAEDDQKMLWVGTTHGLVRIDPSTMKNHRFFFDTVAHGENNSYFISLLTEGDTVWAGNNSRGLLKYRRSNGSYDQFRHNEHDQRSISHNTTMCIHRDRKGRLWIATLGGGLNQVFSTPKGVEFRHFTTRDGLSNDQIYGILEDDDGMLWLSTNNGLSKFDPDKLQFQNYSMNDGLPSQEYIQNSYHRGASGALYFGGISGIVRFFPNDVQIDTIAPPVEVTSFSLFNEERNDLLREGSLVLSHEQNFFSFEFASLSFESPEDNRYSWKLEGLDEEWSVPSLRRFASYTGVPPGTYTFRVKASNGDGVWNEVGAAIPIEIIPPYWETVWFRVLAVTLFIGMMVGSVRFISYRKYRRQIEELEQQKRILEERQRTRDKIARDLHDDLASTVGSAGLFVETAKRTMGEDSVQAREYLDKTSSILNEAEEAMSDIVWSVSPKHDTLQSLVTRIRLVTTELCRANGIRSSVEVKGNIDIPLTDEVRRGVYLIFKEGLNNCLKHSKATMVEVCVGSEASKLILQVRDNGIGFSPGYSVESLGGNGMNNIRKRAEEIGAAMIFTSAPNDGVTIRVEKELTQLSH